MPCPRPDRAPTRRGRGRHVGRLRSQDGRLPAYDFSPCSDERRGPTTMGGRMRVNPELLEADRRARAVELRQQGVMYREVGRVLGISHEQARRYARDAGVTAVTSVPDDIGPRGSAFWADAVAVCAFDRHELELLTQACRLLDRAAESRAIVARDGVMG